MGLGIDAELRAFYGNPKDSRDSGWHTVRIRQARGKGGRKGNSLDPQIKITWPFAAVGNDNYSVRQWVSEDKLRLPDLVASASRGYDFVTVSDIKYTNVTLLQELLRDVGNSERWKLWPSGADPYSRWTEASDASTWSLKDLAQPKSHSGVLR
eukprot:COSAG05_NODE_5203_length_1237_cov_20.144112_2_plen_153_part_00